MKRTASVLVAAPDQYERSMAAGKRGKVIPASAVRIRLQGLRYWSPWLALAA